MTTKERDYMKNDQSKKPGDKSSSTGNTPERSPTRDQQKKEPARQGPGSSTDNKRPGSSNTTRDRDIEDSEYEL